MRQWLSGALLEGRSRLPGAAAYAFAAAAVLLVTTPAPAQSLLERPPNLGGTWVAAPGQLQFHFLHRFEAGGAPARDVANSPTFLLSGGLPGNTMVGARYATQSLAVFGYPNEWEFFGRWNPLAESRGHPVDAALHAGWNQAAGSVDGELTLARWLGAVRLVGAVRGFSDAYGTGESRAAVAGGVVVRLHEWIALAGDVGTLLDREDAEELPWGAGVQLRIPYTPHTLSLHVSSVNATTLQSASVGTRRNPQRWGFEFTIPVTPSRWMGGREAAQAPPAREATVAATVTMDNRLRFLPDTVRITAGEAVRWRNTSDVMHTVTADPEKVVREEHVRLPEGAEPFDSGDMAPGAEFVRSFTVPGTYIYFCIPHELAGMVGTIIVEEAP